MIDKENIYDEQISLLLLQIWDICRENNIPMFADFQLSDDLFCTTALDINHPIIRYYQALSQCPLGEGVNLDKFLFWVLRECRGKTHSSMFLAQLGISPDPAER